MGGDPADDMIDDVEDAMDGDKEGEEKGEDDEDIQDRVVDLEDAFDDPKAEFEKMMGDKEEQTMKKIPRSPQMTWVMKKRKTRLNYLLQLGVEEMPAIEPNRRRS